MAADSSLPSAPVASAPKEETTKDIQSRVVGVPSDRPMGSTAPSNKPWWSYHAASCPLRRSTPLRGACNCLSKSGKQ